MVTFFISICKEVPLRRNNDKVDSIETRQIDIAHLLPWSDLEKLMLGTFLHLMMIKFYRHDLIYDYNFACLLFDGRVSQQTIDKSFKF